jgi:peptide deformylase
VVVVGGDPEGREYMVLYNPSVTAVAADVEAGEEGSVSAPGIRIQLDRPVWAEVAFMDAAGRTQTVRFERFAARVALHEIEQMNGVFFLNKLSRLKRDMVLKRARKLSG